LCSLVCVCVLVLVLVCAGNWWQVQTLNLL
jgi:hypothetical protein